MKEIKNIYKCKYKRNKMDSDFPTAKETCLSPKWKDFIKGKINERTNNGHSYLLISRDSLSETRRNFLKSKDYGVSVHFKNNPLNNNDYDYYKISWYV